MDVNGSPIIAVDFDGTIVDHRFPDIGAPVPRALETIRQLITLNARIVLWTMRSGESLDDAVRYLFRNGITPWGVNANPTQSGWTTSPKAYAHYYIDDSAIGCPLMRVPGFARPCVDWTLVSHIVLEREFGMTARTLLSKNPNRKRRAKSDGSNATDG